MGQLTHNESTEKPLEQKRSRTPLVRSRKAFPFSKRPGSDQYIPELIERRSKRIAGANAANSKESDAKLARIFKAFQKF